MKRLIYVSIVTLFTCAILVSGLFADTPTNIPLKWSQPPVRNADDTIWLLYDDDNDTELWPNDTNLTVDMVEFLPFIELVPALQMYVTKLAGRKFQSGDMGSKVLWQFTEQEVQEAMVLAMQEDEESRDHNMFRDNPSAYAIVARYNPYFGRG